MRLDELSYAEILRSELKKKKVMIKDKTIKFYLLCCQNLFVCHAVKTDVTHLAGFNDAEVVWCELTDRVWVYNQKLDG